MRSALLVRAVICLKFETVELRTLSSSLIQISQFLSKRVTVDDKIWQAYGAVSSENAKKKLQKNRIKKNCIAPLEKIQKKKKTIWDVSRFFDDFLHSCLFLSLSMHVSLNYSIFSKPLEVNFEYNERSLLSSASFTALPTFQTLYVVENRP